MIAPEQSSHPVRTHKTWPLVVLLVLIVVLVCVLLYRSWQAPSYKDTAPASSTANNQVTTKDVVISGSKDKPMPDTGGSEDGDVYTKTDNPVQDSATQQAGEVPQSSKSSSGKQYPLGLGCFVSEGVPCVILQNDPLYSVLGQNTGAVLVVNGVEVTPRKIVLQTDMKTHTDEPTRDYAGKTITSSHKVYNPSTETLTLTIGVNEQYHNGLKQPEQRTLFIAQIVRSFMVMFGESSEDFVEVQRAVSELASWEPTFAP